MSIRIDVSHKEYVKHVSGRNWYRDIDIMTNDHVTIIHHIFPGEIMAVAMLYFDPKDAHKNLFSIKELD